MIWCLFLCIFALTPIKLMDEITPWHCNPYIAFQGQVDLASACNISQLPISFHISRRRRRPSPSHFSYLIRLLEHSLIPITFSPPCSARHQSPSLSQLRSFYSQQVKFLLYHDQFRSYTSQSLSTKRISAFSASKISISFFVLVNVLQFRESCVVTVSSIVSNNKVKYHYSKRS